MSKFPLPPKAVENSELISRRLKEAVDSGRPAETVTVEWNNKPLHVGVVEVPLRDLYYNPATHRIRAQRSLKPELEQKLTADPWLPESQEYLHYLLLGKPANPDESDRDFETLKESLAEVGQKEAGLVTREGILVNGNTRAAALKELKQTSIRVGVLPASFTWDDIASVELALQLRPDKRRDYSYINRLLAMEEQAFMGRAAEDIARDFHIQTRTYHQERWILEVIQEMISRSQTVDGARLRLVDFEGHQENLKELHRNFTSQQSQDQAERVKENRISAIILGFAKTRTRLIGEDFQEKHLTKHLPVEFQSAGGVNPVAGKIPGLNVTAPAVSGEVAKARAITDRILQAVAAEVSNQLPSEATVDARAAVVAVRKGMRRALDVAERDDKLRRVQQTAAERLDDASAAINQSISDLVQARSTRSLDEDGFDEAVVRLRGSLAKLARQAVRGLDEPGDGVAWLSEAVRGEKS
ncbi:transcriptional regulator [Streptomyces sp. H27-D2]|uniref:transcriptional regulator n=1 Tax=Streptomyces sp. H27-D2 TaxID=3046304 RepID=UPI002DBC98F3|nr:transcriptional regulator [Streptomyces sp. H27-D2]MEC4018125.1 transcriptional regulator [Streptomyces sp. H27-D2]